jgi:hypothetical protein
MIKLKTFLFYKMADIIHDSGDEEVDFEGIEYAIKRTEHTENDIYDEMGAYFEDTTHKENTILERLDAIEGDVSRLLEVVYEMRNVLNAINYRMAGIDKK